MIYYTFPDLIKDVRDFLKKNPNSKLETNDNPKHLMVGFKIKLLDNEKYEHFDICIMDCSMKTNNFSSSQQGIFLEYIMTKEADKENILEKYLNLISGK